MDISGTAKKVQRATKVAEESYKKMQVMMEQLQQLQNDMETTSQQVDDMEYEMAQQRALLEAIADEQGLDVEDVLDTADLPEPPQDDATADESTEEPSSESGEDDDT
ncbi:hypothetical protein SAMN05216226_102256 [Halovenus aranensis]|jgi:DNA anti-recombination protein RmuC|uniref:Uncharacterized protein n=1 Tax=Halovenus aranensis TaxID=890420 RepID=A0A1G8T0Z0_9EURY|nr:DUF5798 family protein [Halovenus aranensis]SDJ35113.1 hypothetical protein SAMN05216226_102256 [Halovenus aranensis]